MKKAPKNKKTLPGHHNKDERDYPGEWKAQKENNPNHLKEHAKRGRDRRAYLKANGRKTVPENKELDHPKGKAKGKVVLISATFNEAKSPIENLTKDKTTKKTKLRQLRDKVAKKHGKKK
jgi:hypothetical protein